MARKKVPENYEKMKHSIVEASIELMVTESVTDFSLTDVAKAVGITKAAIYWYFPNKSALIDDVVQCVYDTYLGFVEKIAESDLSSHDKLKKVILGESDTIQAAMMCVFPIKFYLESYKIDSAAKGLIQNGYGKYKELIVELISEGIESGEFQTELPVEELAVFITGAIDGLAFQNLLNASKQIQVKREIIFTVIEKVLKPV